MRGTRSAAGVRCESRGAAGGAPRSSGVDYQAALAAPGRPAEDREQDAWRKPAESLAFFGVQPGMSVLDLYAGAGYFTELLAAVVGPTGHVVAHNNKAYLDGVGEELTRRFADPQRLANVEQLTAEANELELEPGRFDFVLLSAVYHDVYYVNEARQLAEDRRPEAARRALRRHEAWCDVRLDRSCRARRARRPRPAARCTASIPEIVKRDFAAAGFVLDSGERRAA